MNTETPLAQNPEVIEGTLLPCNCAFDPDGNWIIVCDAHKDALTDYLRVARQAFKLQVLGDSNRMRDR